MTFTPTLRVPFLQARPKEPVGSKVGTRGGVLGLPQLQGGQAQLAQALGRCAATGVRRAAMSPARLGPMASGSAARS